jgi:spoIIIJ-associated protein
MSNKKREIESRGANVEMAIKAGLDQLGVGRNDVLVEIVDEGSRGILGIGKRDAVVRLTDVSASLKETTAPPQQPQKQPQRPPKSAEPKAKPAPRREEPPKPKPEPEPKPAPVVQAPPSVVEKPAKPAVAQVDEEETYDIIDYDELVAEEERSEGVVEVVTPDSLPDVLPTDTALEVEAALEIVSELLRRMDIAATVTVEMSEEDDVTRERIPIIKVDGDDLGALIGPRGKTLNALQFLSRSMVSQQIKGRTSFVVDVGGYRERRMQVLTELAQKMADKVVKQGRPLALNPMPPHERRVIHMTLREDERVVTKSAGEGKRRRVRIMRSRRKGDS